MAAEFTHIVIGAGAAGAVLAARLSEDPDIRVLLVEAGGPARGPLVSVPLMTVLLMRSTRHAWLYQTEPSPGLEGRRIVWPRGRALGGSTVINGMVYVRGLPSDYDGWAQRGLPGWSWEAVRPYFLRSERFLGPGGEAAAHGANGPLPVSRPERPVSPLADAFIEAGIAAGYPACTDFNGAEPEGFGFYHFTNRRGRRVSTARAFLDPVRDRPNLSILTGAEAVRLRLANGRATGVELRRGRRSETVHCAGEIILSAGAIGSPALLMRSGIGPPEHLAALGIPVAVEAPEVGANLHDHVLVRLKQAATGGTDLWRLSRPHRAAAAFLRAWAFGTGPMAVFPLEAGAYLRSPGADLPDLQSHFLPALSSTSLRMRTVGARDPLERPGFMANIGVMRPQSRGRLRLRSADPADPPLIAPNYLAERADVERLIDGLEIMREVFAQAPFDRWRGAELDPGPEIAGRRALEGWVRRTADTVHHAVGTCRMGADPASVVDGALRVRGVAGLRVADASVFPAIPSTNTAAPAIMVGEKAADLVLGREAPEAAA
ncbi:MAG: choline dehydrogenase [Alphaproteobacteria bacterium]|nr:MAG: choline dehydrogenase [Alphaproteobacteria bacterium]